MGKHFSRERLSSLLNLLRLGTQKSAFTIAKDLRLTAYRYKNIFEHSKYLPSLQDVTNIALYFGVSLDWLLAAAKPANEIEMTCEKILETENGHQKSTP